MTFCDLSRAMTPNPHVAVWGFWLPGVRVDRESPGHLDALSMCDAGPERAGRSTHPGFRHATVDVDLHAARSRATQHGTTVRNDGLDARPVVERQRTRGVS
jgi:hypothetical protein